MELVKQRVMPCRVDQSAVVMAVEPSKRRSSPKRSSPKRSSPKRSSREEHRRTRVKFRWPYDKAWVGVLNLGQKEVIEVSSDSSDSDGDDDGDGDADRNGEKGEDEDEDGDDFELLVKEDENGVGVTASEQERKYDDEWGDVPTPAARVNPFQSRPEPRIAPLKPPAHKLKPFNQGTFVDPSLLQNPQQPVFPPVRPLNQPPQQQLQPAIQPPQNQNHFQLQPQQQLQSPQNQNHFQLQPQPQPQQPPRTQIPISVRPGGLCESTTSRPYVDSLDVCTGMLS